MHTQAHLNEELPNLILLQRPSHLPFQMFAYITIFTIFHNNINWPGSGKGIKILAHIIAIDLGEDLRFKYGIVLLLPRHLRDIDSLENIYSSILFPSYFIDYAKWSRSQFLKLLEITFLRFAFCCGGSCLLVRACTAGSVWRNASTRSRNWRLISLCLHF